MTRTPDKPIPRDALSQLAVLTRQLREPLLEDLTDSASSPLWRGHQTQFQQQTGVEGKVEFADTVAQAVTCGCFALRTFQNQLQGTRGLAWLIDGADPLVRDILVLCSPDAADLNQAPAILRVSRKIDQFLDRDRVEAIRRSLPAAPSPSDAVVYFFEQFLAAYDQTARRRMGVFYTPHALVSFLVRSVDLLLRDEFHLKGGLADEATWLALTPLFEHANSPSSNQVDPPFVRLLDPAMGTGAFLLEVATVARQRFCQTMVPATSTAAHQNRLWNAYVLRSLLPRIWGQELMLPALVLAQLAMTAWLAESGFRFEQAGKLHFYLANTLQQPQVAAGSESIPSGPFTIVLGNPPFSGVSDNRQAWMRDLLRGRSPNRGDNSDPLHPTANYFLSQGRPLQERKHWLEDDYVKFIRFAHWQIETARTGIVALVTNHGYLDNSTFRGMREQLLATFPYINIVDLHGNTRNGERPPDGGADQSVFDIEQGVAISLLRRPFAPCPVPRVAHTDLWGNRSSKLQMLQDHDSDALSWKTIKPQSPYFFLAPKNHRRLKEYEAGYRLCDIMPVNSTAVVTARDGFVVDFDAAELQQRLRQFADLQISEDDIRARFFLNTRSRKYPPGDTRGWCVTDARQQIHDDPNWERHIRPCLYRPFDRRQIFWAPGMIDWPRNNVMDHLVSEDNLALIARRQMPPTRPCNYFWVSDTIALDGVVRSDNRGSESVFPLFLSERSPTPQAERGDRPDGQLTSSRQPNFSQEFVEASAAKLGLAWTPKASEQSPETLTPHALFHYIYALFHCPSYRQRFAAQLCLDFPRVLIPRQPTLFFEMARLGETLVNAHLLRFPHQPTRSHRSPMLTHASEFRGTIDRGYPQFREQTIWLNKTTGVAPVAEEIWEFQVGTYQVCRKWLKDRRQRVLTRAEIEQYCLILQAIDETIQTMVALDRHIERYGSWEAAF